VSEEILISLAPLQGYVQKQEKKKLVGQRLGADCDDRIQDHSQLRAL
jgi:hypothetical protein